MSSVVSWVNIHFPLCTDFKHNNAAKKDIVPETLFFLLVFLIVS
jgi:hypothetical protein